MQRSWQKNPWIVGGIVFLAICTILCLFPFGLFKLADTKTSTTQSASTLGSPSKTPEVPGTPKPTYVSTRTATPTPTVTPTSLPVGAAFFDPSKIKGLACVNAAGKLSCLDDSAWQTIPLDFVKQYAYVYDIAACSDGSLLVGHYEGASLWDGSKWVHLYTLPINNLSSIHRVACTGDGTKWVAVIGDQSKGAIIKFSGSKQEKYTWQQVLEGTGLELNPYSHNAVRDMVLTPDGELWALITVNYKSDEPYLVHFNGSDWRYIVNAPPELNTLAVSSDGELWAIDDYKIFQFTSNAWIEMGGGGFSDLFIDSNDRVWLATKWDNVLVSDQETLLTYDVTDGERISRELITLAIDGRGRLWVGSKWGLNVFDGSKWHAYEMTNSDIADFWISEIVIFDGGPDLPAPLKKGTGSASGIARKGEVPIHLLEVEVCQKHFPSVFSYYGTPCDGERMYHRTFTREDGAYRFDELPPGFYSVFFKVPNEGWDFGPVFTVEPGLETLVKDIEVEEQ